MADDAVARLMAWERLRPPLPFDLEPSLFPAPRYYSRSQFERDNRIRQQYAEFLAWCDARDQLLAAARAETQR